MNLNYKVHQCDNVLYIFKNVYNIILSYIELAKEILFDNSLLLHRGMLNNNTGKNITH